MPVYSSTSGIGLLNKRGFLQTSTRENCLLLTKQRNDALELHSRLVGEYHLQSRLQELNKKERYTAWFPLLAKQTDRPKNPQMLSTFRTNITHFKPIKKRVCSATDVGPKVICDRRYVLEDSRLCRHFCELLGPNLCTDCTKLRERLEAYRENEKPIASFHLERDPFTALVSSHYYDKECETDDESDEEVIVSDLSDHEDLDHDVEILRKQSPVSKVYFSASPPARDDSGYSSRVSYIKDLTRPQSCDSLLRSFSTTPSTPIRREKTRIRGIKTQNSPALSPTREESLDVYGFTKTLEKLKKRKEVFGVDKKKENNVPVAWRKTPVEPVLMELKLINFTQYDKLGYEPPPPEPEPPEPVIPTDEFGFPLMNAIQISPVSL